MKKINFCSLSETRLSNYIKFNGYVSAANNKIGTRMCLQHIKKIILFCSTFLLLSCSSGKSIEKEFDLLDLSYENFNNQSLQYNFSEKSPKSVKISIKGTTDSCPGVKINDESKLRLYIDFSNLKEGDYQEFPMYIKYDTTICDFDINPSNAYFDISLK